MPDTLVPPELFINSEIYKTLHEFMEENERVKEAFTTNIYEDEDQIDTRMRILSTLDIKLNDDQLGLCSSCFDGAVMYKYSLTYIKNMVSPYMAGIDHLREEIDDNTIKFTSVSPMCKSCITRQVIQYGLHGLGNYLYGRSAYDRIIPDSAYPAATVSYNTCKCCDGILFTREQGAHRDPVVAMGADGVNYDVHYTCTWRCESCDVHYISSWRNRELQVHQYTLNNNATCTTCLGDEDQYNKCDNCGGYIDYDLVYSELRGEDLCEPCYESPIECSDCGWEYSEGDDHYCRDDDDESSSYIYNYSYKPSPKFFGDDRVYMGFELEVEASQRRSNLSEGAEYVATFDDNSRRLYLKSDGSLSYGFEIVTHPHTLDEYHKLDLSWMDKLRTMGYRSWDASSCGIHVHVGLTAFVNENHQIRFTKFIYDNERQVKRISGRTSSYASFTDKGRAISKIKNKANDCNRYSAVNVQNDMTLEVRVFRGSLRKERLLSAIEFVHAVTEYTRSLAIVPKDKPFSWAKFVAYIVNNSNTYPNLFIIINETFDNDNSPTNEEDD